MAYIGIMKRKKKLLGNSRVILGLYRDNGKWKTRWRLLCYSL